MAEHLRAQRERLANLHVDPSDPLERAAAYGAAGQVYHTYGFLDAAEASYLNAQRLAGDDYRWAYYLGRIYRAQGRFVEAIEQLRRSLERKPDDVPAAISLAEVLREANRVQEAEAVLTTLLDRRPGHAVALYVLGQVQLDVGDAAAAVGSLSAALAAQPHATRIHYPLAAAYRETGDLDRAEAHLRQRGDGRLTFSDPLMTELSRLNRGVQPAIEAGAAALRRGDINGAVRHFRAATAGTPAPGDHALEGARLLAEAHHALASALYARGDVGQAEAEYLNALRIHPTFLTAHYNLALLLDSLGRAEEAIQHYERVVDIEPGYADALPNLIADLEQLGRCGEALLHARQLPGFSRDREPEDALRGPCSTARYP